MSFISSRIIEWLINIQVIDREDRELYEYAVYSICITMLPLFLSIAVGALQRNIKGYVLVIIPFLFLRKFSGGYHAKNAFSCLIESIILLTVFAKIADSCINTFSIILASLLSIIVLVINSPIDSENRRLDDYEKNTCRHVVWVICGILFVIDILLYVLDYRSELRYIMCGVILTAVMQIPGIIEKI